jgi:hypothetical protein
LNFVVKVQNLPKDSVFARWAPMLRRERFVSRADDSTQVILTTALKA